MSSEINQEVTMPCSAPRIFQQDVNGDGILDRVVRREQTMLMGDACNKRQEFRWLLADQPLSGALAYFKCHSANSDQKQQTVCGVINEVEFKDKRGKTEMDLGKIEFLAGDSQFVRVGDRVTMQFCEQRRTKSGVDSYSCTGQIKSFAVFIMSDGKAVVEARLGGVKGMPENVLAELSDLKK